MRVNHYQIKNKIIFKKNFKRKLYYLLSNIYNFNLNKIFI